MGADGAPANDGRAGTRMRSEGQGLPVPGGEEPAGGRARQRGLCEISQRLGMAPGAARMAVLRLRQRHAELLRAELAQTVSRAEEVDEEMRFLLDALSS